MKQFGIDISCWQGEFDFEKAIKGDKPVEFAILKAGGGDDGLYKDSKFERNYAECKRLGLPVGAYFFGRATTINKAREEAYYFISLLKDKQFEYPVYYDVEAKMVTQTNKNTLTDIVLTFCKTLEDAGYWVGIYASQSCFDSELNDSQLSKYSHWVASWGRQVPDLKSKNETQLWQFGGEVNKMRTNKIAGVICDQNYCYVDYPSEIKHRGLNGFSAAAENTEVEINKKVCKPINEVAQEVIDGKWGNGKERKEKLTQAGYDYNIVQKTVNELMTKKSNMEIAKEVIAGKWGNGQDRKNRLIKAGYNYDAIQREVNNLM